MTNIEYVIWGKSPDDKEERLLATKFDNKLITDLTTAKKIVEILLHNHGCKDLRIQEINFNTPIDFISTLNK